LGPLRFVTFADILPNLNRCLVLGPQIPESNAPGSVLSSLVTLVATFFKLSSQKRPTRPLLTFYPPHCLRDEVLKRPFFWQYRGEGRLLSFPPTPLRFLVLPRNLATPLLGLCVTQEVLTNRCGDGFFLPLSGRPYHLRGLGSDERPRHLQRSATFPFGTNIRQSARHPSPFQKTPQSHQKRVAVSPAPEVPVL